MMDGGKVVAVVHFVMKWASAICDVTGHTHIGLTLHLFDRAITVLYANGTMAIIAATSRDIVQKLRAKLARLHNQ